MTDTAASAATGVPLVGVVTEFDDERGLGTVAAGGAAWTFHCTALTDGTRTVEVGTRVAFVVVTGHLGRSEARGLTTVAGES